MMMVRPIAPSYAPSDTTQLFPKSPTLVRNLTEGKRVLLTPRNNDVRQLDNT